MLNGVEYIETLKVTFKKQLKEDKITFKTAFFNSKTQTIININEIKVSITNSSQQILNGFQKVLVGILNQLMATI